MSLLLEAIGRASRDGSRTANRTRVVASVYATRSRVSVLGTYSINSNGDTTISPIGPSLLPPPSSQVMIKRPPLV